MKLSVVGAGYVGLVTGACLAEKGHQVICVDVDEEKVRKIGEAIPPIHEEGLAELLKRNVSATLRATTQLYRSVIETDVTFIAVGTPSSDDEIDLTYVKEVARQIGLALRDKAAYHLVVVKSTVVPGTTDEIVRPILEQASAKKAGLDFGLGMNPEFLTEGVAVRDFMFPDRIVLGGLDQRSQDRMEEVYSPFPGIPRVRTNNKTAEMIKYTSNALLATMISFSNEIGNLCATVGDIDVVDVMQAIHINQYLSTAQLDGTRLPAPITSFLEAGCGFGGSCLPKDIKALITHGRKAGRSMRLLDAVIQVNELQHQEILNLLKIHFPSLAGVRITVLGLAFKPDTDDVRASPAIPIVQALVAQKACLKLYDPVANHHAQSLFGNDVRLCDDIQQALTDVEAIVLVTRWEQFKIVPSLLAQLNPQAVLIDGRRILDKHSIAKYEGIGL